MTDYSNLLLDAVRCAQEAGKIHLSFFRKGNFAIEAKHNNESDIVTSADKAAEASIINFIHNLAMVYILFILLVSIINHSISISYKYFNYKNLNCQHIICKI